MKIAAPEQFGLADGPNSWNVIDPPADAVTPVRVALSVMVPGGNVPAVAVVEMVGVVGLTVEVSPRSPHLPVTGSLFESPVYDATQ